MVVVLVVMVLKKNDKFNYLFGISHPECNVIEGEEPALLMLQTRRNNNSIDGALVENTG